MSANLTANQTMDLIREAMEAQFSIERSKLLVENAKTALEAARTAVELAKAEEATAKNGLDTVLLKGEGLGLSRRVVKSLSEELSSSILSSGLIKVEETETANVVAEAEQPIKRRATRTRRQEGETEATETTEVVPQVEATSVVAHTEYTHVVEAPVEVIESVEVTPEPTRVVEVETVIMTPEVEVSAPVVTHVEPLVEEVITAETTEVPVEAPKPVEMPRKQPMFLRNLNTNTPRV